MGGGPRLFAHESDQSDSYVNVSITKNHPISSLTRLVGHFVYRAGAAGKRIVVREQRGLTRGFRPVGRVASESK